MTFPSITNRGEFFSNHYLDAVIGGDLGDLRKAWDEAEGKGEPSARSTLKGAASRFFKTRATASEATGDRATAAVEHLNDVVLQALGFQPNRQDLELTRNTTDKLTIPTAATAETGTGLWLVALDAGLADSADDLFDDGPPNNDPAAHDRPAAGRLLKEGLRHGDGDLARLEAHDGTVATNDLVFPVARVALGLVLDDGKAGILRRRHRGFGRELNAFSLRDSWGRTRTGITKTVPSDVDP